MEETSLPMWFWVIYWIVLLINVASLWKLFLKANQPGWASIIPIYNTVVFLQIAGKPIWWLILIFIPGVNFVVGIIVLYDFCKAYGKSSIGFYLGMLILSFIFYPILAFTDTQYLGPGGKQAPTPENPNQPPPPPIPQSPNTL
jgi:hypothetical protein